MLSDQQFQALADQYNKRAEEVRAAELKPTEGMSASQKLIHDMELQDMRDQQSELAHDLKQAHKKRKD